MLGFGNKKEPFKLESITSGYGMDCARLKSIRQAQGYEVVMDRYSLEVKISCSDIKKVTLINNFNNVGTSYECSLTFWSRSDMEYFKSIIEQYSSQRQYSFNRTISNGWKLPNGDFVMGFFKGGSNDMYYTKVYPPEQVEER